MRCFPSGNVEEGEEIMGGAEDSTEQDIDMLCLFAVE
jgi:hypothetical protein